MRLKLATTLLVLAPLSAFAACPSPNGAWELNFAPVSAAASQNGISFANTNILFALQGNAVNMTYGFGVEIPTASDAPTVGRTFDDATGTATRTGECTFRMRISGTEKVTVGEAETPGVAVSLRANGVYVPVLKGFAGTMILQDRGRTLRNGFTMTRIPAN